MTFSPDTRAVATAGASIAAPDRSWRLWDIDVERVAARICALAWPAISEPECNQYFPGMPYQPPCR